MTISNYLEEAWLKTIRGGGNGTNFTAPAAVYAKLHTGDPGEDGTSSAAGETTRQAVTFGAPTNPGGVMSLASGGAWTNVSTAETYSHISLWDDPAAGNCLGSGALTAPKTVAIGDNFTLTALTYTLV
jgi:hypothetical protein